MDITDLVAENALKLGGLCGDGSNRTDFPHDVEGEGANADDDRYLATMVKIDRTLGNLFDRLKDRGKADNTVIVITSDNGPSALQRYYKNSATAPNSVLALRGRKTETFPFMLQRRR